jgi:YfiH family protein
MDQHVCSAPVVLVSALLRDAGFRHGFATRVGGVSAAPFDTLDFGVQDDAANVAENLRRLGAAVGFDPASLYQASQVHGAGVLVASGGPSEMRTQEADALVAFAPSFSGGAASVRPLRSVGVRVADCTPVLVGDPLTGAALAIHAGWRGVVAHVVAAGVSAMRARHPSRLVAAIGPSIGVCCFEVGEDVAESIATACGDASLAEGRGNRFGSVVVRGAHGSPKPHVDMRRAVRAQLRALGLADASIEDVPGCTKCDAEHFFSYRRDGAKSGRHIAVIAAR